MDETDSEIITRARDGDEDAFRLLVERHSLKLFRLAYRMTQSEADAEDIVQEVFMKVHRQLGTFELRSNFGTWLHRIAVNSCLDLLRKKKRHQRASSFDEHESTLESLPSGEMAPDSATFQAEVRQQVTVALDELTHMEKAAFVLRHFEERSIEEIGSILGVGCSATKQSIFRAVKKLRRVLEPLVRQSQ